MTPWALCAAVQDFAASPHGRAAASSGIPDQILVGAAVAVVVLAFALCLRFFLRPGETDPGHIKREILRETPTRLHRSHEQ
ncbi:MAG: hypothetical protein RQ751_04070 [Longimicrobiales bacterium]|nr:hypothetical protein [Longimicrobiales bacterium]